MRRQFPRGVAPFRRQRGYISLNRFDGFGARRDGAASFVCDGADFDAADVVSRLSALTGSPTATTGIFSCWVNPDADSDLGCFGGGYGAGDAMWTLSLSDHLFQGRAGGGGIFFHSQTNSNAWSTGGGWYHILQSWQGTGSFPGNFHSYINDVSNADETSGVEPGSGIDYSLYTHWYLGADRDGAANFVGGIAELYFAPNQFLDFSNSSNRRKFITSGGKPVDLGADGSLPTGTKPLVYCHLDDGETANNFAINRTGSGDFSVTSGALATSGTSPSD